MKKFVLVICAFLSMILLHTSCNKDQASSLVGKWQWIETVVTTYFDEEVYDTYTSTPSGLMLLEFKSNGTYTLTEISGSESGSVDGTYKLLDNTVTIENFFGETSTFNIESLSQSSLIIVREDYEMKKGKVYKTVTRARLKKV